MMGGDAQIRACLRPRVPRAMPVRAEEAARAGRGTYFSLQTVTATFFTPVAFRRASPGRPEFRGVPRAGGDDTGAGYRIRA
jgi:hypothetical protein